MTNWAQIFTGLLFYAYVEIHQVRILVFDKTCSCAFTHEILHFMNIALFDLYTSFDIMNTKVYLDRRLECCYRDSALTNACFILDMIRGLARWLRFIFHNSYTDVEIMTQTVTFLWKITRNEQFNQSEDTWLNFSIL